MLRTFHERQTELQALRELASAAHEDGDDNRDAIDAQINTIDSVLTREEIHAEYENDSLLLEAALEAEKWLREDDEAPSEVWAEQIRIAA